MRKVAVSLADSIDLRIILSVLYIMTEVIRTEKVAGSADFKEIVESFTNELSTLLRLKTANVFYFLRNSFSCKKFPHSFVYTNKQYSFFLIHSVHRNSSFSKLYKKSEYDLLHCVLLAGSFRIEKTLQIVEYPRSSLNQN